MFVASPSIFRDLSSRSLSPLPVQQPRGILVERSRLISQRNILSALTAGILALPSLSAPLIICKTNPAVRTPVPASRARRRYPVVNTSAMLAVAADWHTSSSVPKTSTPRDIATFANQSPASAQGTHNDQPKPIPTPRLFSAISPAINFANLTPKNSAILPSHILQIRRLPTSCFLRIRRFPVLHCTPFDVCDPFSPRRIRTLVTA
jgi:hypothetical protein